MLICIAMAFYIPVDSDKSSGSVYVCVPAGSWLYDSHKTVLSSLKSSHDKMSLWIEELQTEHSPLKHVSSLPAKVVKSFVFVYDKSLLCPAGPPHLQFKGLRLYLG